MTEEESSACNWLVGVEEGGREKGTPAAAMETDGEGLEEGGEGRRGREGWRVRVLNAGVIAASSERVQRHSMSPWSYCMAHSGAWSLSLFLNSQLPLREKMWT
jgi:hypothetical protein